MFAKIAISLTVMLGTASAVLAGPKDPLWPITLTANAASRLERQIPASPYATFASAPGFAAPTPAPAMWAHPR
jgi:hypothetical protein